MSAHKSWAKFCRVSLQESLRLAEAKNTISPSIACEVANEKMLLSQRVTALGLVLGSADSEVACKTLLLISCLCLQFVVQPSLMLIRIQH